MYVDALNKTLAVSDNPGLDTFDPRLSEVTTTVQTGDFTTACNQIVELFNDQEYDIRLIGYLAFGDFIEGGVKVIPDILSGLNIALDNNWDAFGPIKNKEKHARSFLTWFLKNLMKVLEHAQSEHGGRWTNWLETTDASITNAMVTNLTQLMETIQSRLGGEADKISEGLAKFRNWATNFNDMQTVAQAVEPEKETVVDGPPSDGGSSNDGLETTMNTGSTQGSTLLAELILKMEAFSTLVSQERFSKAAIVAADIEETLSNFDPALYFPSLFAAYKKDMAINVSEVLEHLDLKDSPQWSAMENYYRVDLKGFLDL